VSTKKTIEKETLTVDELEEKAEALYEDEKYCEAVRIYRIAAAMGGDHAQYSLGFCYENGFGVEEDRDEAMKWYKLAAENGNEDAMYCLAMGMFEDCDFDASAVWFAKAADAGVDDAWYYLGWLFFNGEGVEYNVEKAEKCWSRVINEDQSALQYKIGKAYECWSTSKEIDQTERTRRFGIAANWMKLAAKYGNKDARQWLKEKKVGEAESSQEASIPCSEPPSITSFWKAMIKSVDGHSGLVFSPDSDLRGTTLTTNEYLYKDWFFVFSYFESKGMLISLVVDTESSKDNNTIAKQLYTYLKENKINTKIFNTVSGGKGRTVVLELNCLDVMNPTTYAFSIERIVDFISCVESAWEEINDEIIQRQKVPLVIVEPENSKSVIYNYDWGKGVHNNVLFRYGSLLLNSDFSLRDEILGSLTTDGKSTCMNDWEIVDEDAGDNVSEEWSFPDNEFGHEAEKLFEEYGEEGLESLGLEGARDMIFFYGPINVKYKGFPIDPGKTPNLQWGDDMYAPKRTTPPDLFGSAT